MRIGPTSTCSPTAPPRRTSWPPPSPPLTFSSGMRAETRSGQNPVTSQGCLEQVRHCKGQDYSNSCVCPISDWTKGVYQRERSALKGKLFGRRRGGARVPRQQKDLRRRCGKVERKGREAEGERADKRAIFSPPNCPISG